MPLRYSLAPWQSCTGCGVCSVPFYQSMRSSQARTAAAGEDFPAPKLKGFTAPHVAWGSMEPPAHGQEIVWQLCLGSVRMRSTVLTVCV